MCPVECIGEPERLIIGRLLEVEAHVNGVTKVSSALKGGDQT